VIKSLLCNIVEEKLVPDTEYYSLLKKEPLIPLSSNFTEENPKKLNLEIIDSYHRDQKDPKKEINDKENNEISKNSQNGKIDSRSSSSSPTDENSDFQNHSKIESNASLKTIPYKSKLIQPKPSKSKRLHFLEESISNPEFDDLKRKSFVRRNSAIVSRIPITEPFLTDKSQENISKFAQQMEFIVTFTVDSMKKKKD